MQKRNDRQYYDDSRGQPLKAAKPLRDFTDHDLERVLRAKAKRDRKAAKAAGLVTR